MSRAKMIPEHINSLADYIEETFSTFSDRPAYSALGQTKTFAEMESIPIHCIPKGKWSINSKTLVRKP